MVCNKCGAALPEGTRFCGVCGQAMPQPVAAAEAPVAKKSRKPLWVFLVVLLCVAALAVGAYFVLFYNAYQSLLDDHFAVTEGDFSDLEELAPPQAWDKLFEAHGVMIESLVNDSRYASVMAQEYQQALQELSEEIDLGANVTYEYDVVCDHPAPQADITNIREGLADTYNINPGSVEDVRVLHIETVMTGDRSEYAGMAENYAVKIDGTWYLINYWNYTYDGEKHVEVSFSAANTAERVIRELKADSEKDEEITTEDDLELEWD